MQSHTSRSQSSHTFKSLALLLEKIAKRHTPAAYLSTRPLTLAKKDSSHLTCATVNGCLSVRNLLAGAAFKTADMQRLSVVAAFKAAGNLAHFLQPYRASRPLLAAAFGAADQTASLILLKFGFVRHGSDSAQRHGQSVVWWASVHGHFWP